MFCMTAPKSNTSRTIDKRMHNNIKVRKCRNVSRWWHNPNRIVGKNIARVKFHTKISGKPTKGGVDPPHDLGPPNE